MASLLSLRGVQYKPKTATIGIEKGGNGKTLITINTALTAAKYGVPTLIVDLDPECCASLFLLQSDADIATLGSLVEVYEHNKQMLDFVVPSRFDGIDILPSKTAIRRLDRLLDDDNPKSLMRRKMQGLREKYGLILFDVPPNFSKLTASAYLSSDIVMVPVKADLFSIESLKLTIEDIEASCAKFEAPKPPLFVLRNHFVNTKAAGSKVRSKASRDINQELLAFAPMMLPFAINQSASLLNSLNDGNGIYDYPKSDSGIDGIRSAFFSIFTTITELKGIDNGF